MTAAIRTHFKTKKRQKKIKQGNKEKQVLKEQRIRSRKNTVSTVKPVLSGQKLKSQNLFPLFALNETFIKWAPLLRGRGHLKSTWNGHFYCYQRVLNGHL